MGGGGLPPKCIKLLNTSSSSSYSTVIEIEIVEKVCADVVTDKFEYK